MAETAFSLDISDTKLSDWKYVAEGGATIVFAYIGSQHPLFTGKVLRLRKRKHHKSHPHALQKQTVSPSSFHGQGRDEIAAEGDGEGAEGTKHAEDEEPDDPMIAFQEQVIGRLVPEEFLVNLRVVKLDREWLTRFGDYHDGTETEEEEGQSGGARPVSRRKVDGIDVRRRKGVLADNLVGGEGMCTIEIKVSSVLFCASRFPSYCMDKAVLFHPAFCGVIPLCLKGLTVRLNAALVACP